MNWFSIVYCWKESSIGSLEMTSGEWFISWQLEIGSATTLIWSWLEGTPIRAIDFNKKSVMNFFNLVETEYVKHRYPPDRIFTVNECGPTVVQTKFPHVIGMKGKKQIGYLTAAEKRSLATIIVCMNAGGNFPLPVMVFPRTNWTNQLMKGARHSSDIFLNH